VEQISAPTLRQVEIFFFLRDATSNRMAQQKENPCSAAALDYFPAPLSVVRTPRGACCHIGAGKAAERLSDSDGAFLRGSGGFHCGGGSEAHYCRSPVSVEQREAAINTRFCVGLRVLAPNDGLSGVNESLASVAKNGPQSGRLAPRAWGKERWGTVLAPLFEGPLCRPTILVVAARRT